MENFNLNQLTKEMVVYRLKALEDPCAAAADIAQKTITVALKGNPDLQSDAGKLVADICQGAMTGLILSDQNLPKGAVHILGKMSEVARELNLDPTEMMQIALIGISGVQKYLKPEQMHQITQEISVNFLGAGEFLLSLIDDHQQASAEQAPVAK